uniref:carbohydrate kinase family protein n=1 Tax=Tessaracoccus timonensis TaxID=2161816 RepID=UPI000D55FEC3|nr:carbohydrate kinase [Tessaracoccus timonensis]
MRFVVLGEALIDLIPDGNKTSVSSSWVARSGGGPMNTAIGLGRLGCDVQFLGRLSEDSFGQQLTEHIETNGVGTDYAIRTFDPTTLAVVSLSDDGKASYAFHTVGTTNFNWTEQDFPELDPSDWLHFGSLVAVLEPSFAQVHRFLSKTPNRKSFDINVRPNVLSDREEYVRKVRAMASLVGQSGGFVKASDEDLAWLVDFKEEPLDVAQRYCRDYSVEFVIVTLGSDGAVAVGRDGELARVPGRRVEVVDTVGAGDTFNAGFLQAFNGDNLEEAMRRGVAASALVCTKAGAQPPTSDEVDAVLA